MTLNQQIVWNTQSLKYMQSAEWSLAKCHCIHSVPFVIVCDYTVVVVLAVIQLALLAGRGKLSHSVLFPPGWKINSILMSGVALHSPLTGIFLCLSYSYCGRWEAVGRRNGWEEEAEHCIWISLSSWGSQTVSERLSRCHWSRMFFKVFKGY